MHVARGFLPLLDCPHYSPPSFLTQSTRWRRRQNCKIQCLFMEIPSWNEIDYQRISERSKERKSGTLAIGKAWPAMSLLSPAGKLSTQWVQWSEFRECKAQCLRKRSYIEKEHLSEKVLQKAIEIRILWMHLKSVAILFTHVNRHDVLLDTVPSTTKFSRRDSQFNTRPDACKRKETGSKCLPFFTSLWNRLSRTVGNVGQHQRAIQRKHHKIVNNSFVAITIQLR